MASQSALATLPYGRVITDTTGQDITGDPVSFAFPARGVDPLSGDWNVAAYEGANTWTVLIGPGGVDLAKGVYDVWQKITDNPVVDAEKVDVLEIT